MEGSLEFSRKFSPPSSEVDGESTVTEGDVEIPSLGDGGAVTTEPVETGLLWDLKYSDYTQVEFLLC